MTMAEMLTVDKLVERAQRRAQLGDRRGAADSMLAAWLASMRERDSQPKDDVAEIALRKGATLMRGGARTLSMSMQDLCALLSATRSEPFVEGLDEQGNVVEPQDPKVALLAAGAGATTPAKSGTVVQVPPGAMAAARERRALGSGR